MQRVLDAMVSLSPVGMAIMACVAFGLALAARQALGMERGLRAAAERARDAAIKTLSANKTWEIEEIGRFRRLLDCHIDAIVAEATEFRERAVPSPGVVLESLCSWHADWKRELSRITGLPSSDVDKLLKNALPVTPGLARKLELFTGAAARYWEYLWRLRDTYRTEVDQTLVMLVDGAQRKRKDAPPEPRPVLELVEDGPAVVAPAPSHAPPAPPARPWLGGLPPPPKPRVNGPSAAPTPGRTPAHGRASTLTDFPVLHGDTPPGGGDGWAEVERSPLNATLPGVGSKPRL